MSSPILNSDSNILLNDIILKTDFHYKYSKGNGSLKKLNLILLKNQIFEFLVFLLKKNLKSFSFNIGKTKFIQKNIEFS